MYAAHSMAAAAMAAYHVKKSTLANIVAVGESLTIVCCKRRYSTDSWAATHRSECLCPIHSKVLDFRFQIPGEDSSAGR